MLSLPREPLFIGDWLHVVMIHLEVGARDLQAVTPFALDLWEGRAFVTLVAFTLRGMHPRLGGRLGELLFTPLATHRFLNVRTYVRHQGEPGIHFLAEWLDNRLAVRLGPALFGLPYRRGRLEHHQEWRTGELCGRVEDARTGARLVYRAEAEIGTPEFAPCAAGSLGEWLMERYTAFNCAVGRRRFFRVWHEPWPQVRVDARLEDRTLLAREWPFLGGAELIGAHYSPGVGDVWMGWPHVLQGETRTAKCVKHRDSVPDSGEFGPFV
jgi:uncharacterized protein YqjF (DUF2071 family)